MAGPKVIIITKKAKGHGHHGGAWKVAYADFVTAMMALFIMLWILSQTDKQTKEVISEYFRSGVFSGAPSAMQGGSGLLDKGYIDTMGQQRELELETLDTVAARVNKQLKEAAESNQELGKLLKDVSVEVTPEGLLIQIVDTKGNMLFDLSSAELKPPLVDLLKVLGPVLSRLQNKVQIHGHTDARQFPAGSPNTNWNLSFHRADRARAILEPLLNPGQIKGVYAHGDSMPADPDPLSPTNRRLAILAAHRDGPKPVDPRTGKAVPSPSAGAPAAGSSPSLPSVSSAQVGREHTLPAPSKPSGN